jgi:hypothetical protein
VTVYAKAERAVSKLIESVRKNRPEDTVLLEYLEGYCRSAWYLGYESGKRSGKRKAGK